MRHIAIASRFGTRQQTCQTQHLEASATRILLERVTLAASDPVPPARKDRFTSRRELEQLAMLSIRRSNSLLDKLSSTNETSAEQTEGARESVMNREEEKLVTRFSRAASVEADYSATLS